MEVVDPQGKTVRLGDLAKQAPDNVDIRGGRVVNLNEFSADKGSFNVLKIATELVVAGTLAVAGAVAFASTLSVAGEVNLGDNLNVAGDATIGGNLSITGSLGAAAFYAGDGSLGLPSYSFYSSPDSGMYTDGFGRVIIGANATMLLFMDSGSVSVVGPAFFTAGGDAAVLGDMSITGGQLDLNNATSNVIWWRDVGVAAPTFGARSAGTKLVLYPLIGGATSDFALGISPATIWFSVPAAAYQFAWYGGTTMIASMSGAGQFSLAIATGTAPFVIASTTLVANLNVDLLDNQHGSFYQNASNLNAGTVPDARFPATLPAISGANLTNLDATDLASGTIPQARFADRAQTTPTVTSGSGSFTSVSCVVDYQEVGDGYLWDVTITITTNGTAGDYIVVPMPFTAARECIGVGRQASAGGHMVQGVIAAGASNMVVVKYENSYPGADGYRITISGHTFV